MATDSRGNEYDPDAGSTEPTEGRCNALLKYYEERYGEKRYCGGMPESTFVEDGSDYCKHHKGREEARKMRAQELFQHGLFTNSVDNLYERLDVNQRVMAWSLFEYLLDESRYEFAGEEEAKTFAVREDDNLPEIPDGAYDEVVVDEDGGVPTEIELEVVYPTDHGDRAMALWLAAVDRVKMHNVQAKIAIDEMEARTVSEAEYDYGDDGSEGEWRTIEEATEHHLNLPYSRLVRDHKELLKYGGIEIDGETDAGEGGIMLSDFNFGVDADPTADAASDEVISKTGEDLDEIVMEED